MKDLSLYIHYPFCLSKCPYCDFNSHVRSSIDYERFTKSYLTELDYFKEKLIDYKIKTIFFGGGTPSLMPAKMIEAILTKIHKDWSLDKDIEITFEANPTSSEIEKFRDFRSLGINRVSIGIQSLNEDDLKFLGREHSVTDAIKAISYANDIFDNYSIDLIYARPNQNIDSWIKELNQAIKLVKYHISLYQLTIEKGTKFYSLYKNKAFLLPNDDLAGKLYDTTAKVLEDNGFLQYEISNYAKKGYESRHNMSYWQSIDYLGIGAGSHSRVYYKNDSNRKAIMNTNKPENWLKMIESKNNSIQTIENVLLPELAEEIILMGMRILDGIDLNRSEELLGKSILEVMDNNYLNLLIKEELILLDNKSLRPTKKGLILNNQIILGLVANVIR